MLPPSLIDLKAAYRRNENIARLLRESNEQGTNDQTAILIAYDLQAGNYVAALADPDFRAAHGRYVDAIAAVLAPLQPRSILEPGVGEATTLRAVLSRIRLPAQAPVLGFDLSWSRVYLGRCHCQEGKIAPNLFVAELESIPLADGAVDVVYTAHAIEANHGREAEILSELYRVTGRYLVLFEPGYELASPEGRARMESHSYCRGLREAAERVGGKVVAHELLSVSLNPRNPTAVLVIEKEAATCEEPFQGFVCPSCRGRLMACQGAYFCAKEGLAYPVLRDVPCLARHNAILASRFLD
jgi:hypothetical protein